VQIEEDNTNGTATKKKGKSKKKVLNSVKQNRIDFNRILHSYKTNDLEILRQTTLMIKNIPMKFSQNDMLNIINEQSRGKYDFFYLPIDIKTKFNMGFAFINMTSPIFILDFYLEFNCCRWIDKIQYCNSQKYCEIVYANMQGIQECHKELKNKSIMKKNDKRIKPIFYENMLINPIDVNAIIARYSFDASFKQYYATKLN